MTNTIVLAQTPAGDRLLTCNSFALLLGMQLDQQIPMERAFAAPYELARRLNAAGRLSDLNQLSAALIADMSVDDVVEIFRARPALHRFPKAMAQRAHQLSTLVCERYGGQAERLWCEAATGGLLLARLRELPGFGDGKARIFLALLAKQRGVRPPGWQEACVPYGSADSVMSVADITDEATLRQVREHKKAAKQVRDCADR
ncbi:MAG: HhH-GPD-type base excision DNA repair protein [Mycobacteriales bacterium]